MVTRTLLPLLADGEYHSGGELARRLGIGRAALWKQLRQLEGMGIAVESGHGRGYCIPGGLELLDEEKVRGALGSRAAGLLREFLLHDLIDSTNAELMRRLQSGAGGGLVCVAEQQSAGRGRRGRHWVSPFAGNLYLSLSAEYDRPGALDGLSLAVGAAVVEALEAGGLRGLQLKWPNDILHRDAKLGGVLIEMSGDTEGGCKAVVGVGININMPGDAAAGIDQAWTDAATVLGRAPGRNHLLGLVLDRLLPLLAEFGETGFAHWRERWEARNIFAGRPVVAQSGGQPVSGTMLGVDDSGALLLQVGATVEAIHGGEVSLRAEP